MAVLESIENIARRKVAEKICNDMQSIERNVAATPVRLTPTPRPEPDRVLSVTKHKFMVSNKKPAEMSDRALRMVRTYRYVKENGRVVKVFPRYKRFSGQ